MKIKIIKINKKEKRYKKKINDQFEKYQQIYNIAE